MKFCFAENLDRDAVRIQLLADKTKIFIKEDLL